MALLGGNRIATARQGRDPGILQSPTWVGCSELSGLLRIPGLCSRLLPSRRETAASEDHPEELARELLRKLCCWVKPTGKSVGVGTTTKKQDNINCFIIHLAAALGKGGERGEKLYGCQGWGLRLRGVQTPDIRCEDEGAPSSSNTASAGNSRKRQTR